MRLVPLELAAGPCGPYGGSCGSSSRHHDTSFGLDDDHYSQHSGSGSRNSSEGGGCRGCEKIRSGEESDRMATSVSSTVNVQGECLLLSESRAQLDATTMPGNPS